jgi:soluble calcium-activated nucleotidase 1
VRRGASFEPPPQRPSEQGLLGGLFYHARISYQSSVNSDRLLFHAAAFDFLAVADLDQHSRVHGTNTWRSFLQEGTLVRNPSSGNFTVAWKQRLVLESHTATKQRAMELSELVRYNSLLLAACDITGLVHKIKLCSGGGARTGQGAGPKPSCGSDVPFASVFQRHAIADGDGNYPKPFKTEWATVKDGLLWVGSTGKEWTDAEGQIVHHNPQWVKTIDSNGRIENYDWRPIYQALRTATGTSHPGYLWHEAVHWDARARRWIFLPRKASRCPLPYRDAPKEVAPDVRDIPAGREIAGERGCPHYTPEHDETMGTNLLLVASEDFSDIRVSRVGPLQADRGFTSLRKVPGTASAYLALKVKEVSCPECPTGTETETLITVFDLETGRPLLDGDVGDRGESVPLGHGRWARVGGGALKFEGLEFQDSMEHSYSHRDYHPAE